MLKSRAVSHSDRKIRYCTFTFREWNRKAKIDAYVVVLETGEAGANCQFRVGSGAVRRNEFDWYSIGPEESNTVTHPLVCSIYVVIKCGWRWK